MKRRCNFIFLLVLVVAFLCTGMGMESFAATEGYVVNGLFALYDGVHNTDEGHNESAATWADLIGNRDMDLTIDENCYFTDTGFLTYAKQHEFASEIVDVVNSEEFTIELLIGEFEASHIIDENRRYSPFINCNNDNISVYYDRDKDGIIFKTASMLGGSRATITVSPEDVENSLLTIVFKKGEPSTLYLNNEENGLKEAQSGGDMTGILGVDNLFIGQATNGKQSKVEYCSIRVYNRALSKEEVTINAERDGVYTAPVSAKAVDVTQPVTNIVGDLAIVDQIDSKAELKEVVGTQNAPATVILHINNKLNVVDEDGNKITTVQDALELLDYKIFPAFYVQDETTVDGLAKVLKKLNFYDLYIMSDKPALVKYAREKMAAVRGVIDYTDQYTEVLTAEQISSIRKTTMKNNGTIAMLSAEVCTKKTVQELYYGRIPVWGCLSKDADKVDTYKAVLSGVMGIVADETETIFDIVCDELEEHTLTRNTLNVGHKGLPSAALENTIEGAKAAVLAGAEFLELDIYMSKDGELVVCHSNTTGAVCDQDLVIGESTWAELQQLKVVRNESEEEGIYPPAKLATLGQFFSEFKNTDIRFFIEFKGGGEEIVNATKKLVEAYDLYDRCHAIAFDQGTMGFIRKNWSEMTIGYLDYNMNIDENNPELDLVTIMSKIGVYNASYSPTMYKMGSVTGLRAAQIRGIMMSGWTYENQSTYLVSYFNGASAITGDDASAMAEYPRYIKVNNNLEHTKIKVGEQISLDITELLYNGSEKVEDELSCIVIKGNDSAKIKGNKLSFSKSGEVTFIIGYTHQITTINEPVLYSAPITLTVVNADGTVDDEGETGNVENDSQVEEEAETTTKEEESESTNTGDTLGKYALMYMVVLLISISIVVYLVMRKRRA